jgi:hypothetical protein
LPRELNLSQQLLKVPAGSPYKGPALEVFVKAGTFSDKQYAGVARPFTGDGVLATIG